MFRKDPFLALFFSLSSLMIFLLLCLLPSAAFFMLTIWHLIFLLLGPYCTEGHTRSSVSTGLLVFSTGIFLSIRANVRPPSSQKILTKLTSSPTSSYSTLVFVLIPLQLFVGSPSFSKHIPSSQGLSLYLCFLMRPL